MYIKMNKNSATKDVLNSLLTINDLKNEQMTLYSTPKREFPQICVIDDLGFPCLSSLINDGYKNIVVTKDFSHIKDYEKYDVILCDIGGVGKDQNHKEQGLAIAKQIHKMYPLKKVFIYSGLIITDYGDCPDDIQFIPKHSHPTEICNILDSACSHLWNPIKAWKFIEIALQKEKVCNKNIAYMEHLFVKSFLDKSNYLEEEKNFLNSLIKVAPLISLASSLVFQILGLVL